MAGRGEGGKMKPKFLGLLFLVVMLGVLVGCTCFRDPEPFDFSLSANPSSGSLHHPGYGTKNVSTQVSASLLSGVPENVFFTISGLPKGVTASHLPGCMPDCVETLKFTVASDAASGTYTITVVGTAESIVRTAEYMLTIEMDECPDPCPPPCPKPPCPPPPDPEPPCPPPPCPPAKGTVTVYKFNDLNANGVHDSGEPYLSGWTFRIYSNASCSGDVLAVKTTGSAGKVVFTDLSPGTYSVREVTQSGWNPTTSTCQSVVLTEGQDKTLKFGNQEVCTPPPPEGTSISATLSGSGYWRQETVYDWTICKSVNPASVVVEQGSSASVTYTIAATRHVASETNDTGVAGYVCVSNDGEVSTENLKVVVRVQYQTGTGPYQDLPGATQTITPSQLSPGTSDCYVYDIAFDSVPEANYRIASKATITNYTGYMGSEFGPEPQEGFSLPHSPIASEIDKNAIVDDVQTCPTNFSCVSDAEGPWFLNTSEVIEFSTHITNECVPCGQNVQLTNTATLTKETTSQKRSDSATVDIYTGDCCH